MFDIDKLEEEWKKLYKALSEEEIYDIYKSDGATYDNLDDRIKDYNNYVNAKITPEERLLYSIFGTNEEIKKKLDEEQQRRENTKYPEENHLSLDKQKIVVEGCMDVVFEVTRKWYESFNGSIDIEDIYYTAIYSLISAVRRCVHNGKMTFKRYVHSYIYTSISRMVAKKLGIKPSELEKDMYFNKVDKYNKNDIEVPTKPGTVNYMLANTPYYENFNEGVSNDEFIKDYNDVINKLPFYEKEVFRLSYDNEGYPGLTYSEISEYLGISNNDVRNAKRRVIRKLRNNDIINSYK